MVETSRILRWRRSTTSVEISFRTYSPRLELKDFASLLTLYLHVFSANGHGKASSEQGGTYATGRQEYFVRKNISYLWRKSNFNGDHTKQILLWAEILLTPTLCFHKSPSARSGRIFLSDLTDIKSLEEWIESLFLFYISVIYHTVKQTLEVRGEMVLTG